MKQTATIIKSIGSKIKFLVLIIIFPFLIFGKTEGHKSKPIFRYVNLNYNERIELGDHYDDKKDLLQKIGTSYYLKSTYFQGAESIEVVLDDESTIVEIIFEYHHSIIEGEKIKSYEKSLGIPSLTSGKATWDDGETRFEIYSLQKNNRKVTYSKLIDLNNGSSLNQKIIPFLTFQKEDAEQAMNFYVSLFPNSKIVDVKRWGKDGPGKEGAIMHATFNLNGHLFMCSDSPPIHDWTFTPAVSNYVVCKSETEIEHLFSKLSENGQVAMPLDNYGFSQKFGWVVDAFGVSWQLNLQ